MSPFTVARIALVDLPWAHAADSNFAIIETPLRASTMLSRRRKGGSSQWASSSCTGEVSHRTKVPLRADPKSQALFILPEDSLHGPLEGRWGFF